MSLDSKAFSRERALIFHDMKRRGWSRMGAFAFSCSAPPGATGETDKFFVEVAGPLLSNNKESNLLPALRRLYFEAWTCSSADLKHCLYRRDDEPLWKLPEAERKDKRAQLAARMGPGRPIDGLGEPSNALVNETAKMYEGNAVKYIASVKSRAARSRGGPHGAPECAQEACGRWRGGGRIGGGFDKGKGSFEKGKGKRRL
jgi:hypothetical protein